MGRRRGAGLGLWLAIPLLQGAGLAGLAAAHAAPERAATGSAALAIVFPPWWSEAQVVGAVRASGAEALPSGTSFIAVVPASAGLPAIPGEWFRFDASADFFCFKKDSVS